MCLSCIIKTYPNVRGLLDVNDIRKLEYHPQKTTIFTHDGKKLKVTKQQFEEIRDNAIGLVVTSVDLSIDIWAIQWPNDYKVKFKG